MARPARRTAARIRRPPGARAYSPARGGDRERSERGSVELHIRRGGASANEIITYTYDASGRLIAVHYNGTASPPNSCTNSTPTWGTGLLACSRWGSRAIGTRQRRAAHSKGRGIRQRDHHLHL